MLTEGSERVGSSVAIVVGNDKASRIALKWATDHILFKGQSVTLLYVNPLQSKTMVVNEVRNILDPDEKYNDLSLPLRVLCASNDINWGIVTIQGQDTAKAIIEYVLLNKMERLVLGSSPRRHNISRLFHKHDVASSVLRGAPDFCTVYVISKGKVASIRPGSCPIRPQLRAERLPHAPENIMAARHSVSAIPRPPIPENRGYDEYSVPSSEVSFLSPGRISTDSMYLGYYDNLSPNGTPPRRVRRSSSMNGSSNFDPLLSEAKFASLNHSADELSDGEEESRDKLLTTQDIDDMEEQMRRLQLEMKQTMDMYHTACKEALQEKQKIKELQLLRKKDEQRLKEAQITKEEALAIVEQEKAKCREAIETAKSMAEQEAQELIRTEREALKQLKSKMKRDLLWDSNKIGIHQSLVHILVVLCVLYSYFITFKRILM